MRGARSSGWRCPGVLGVYAAVLVTRNGLSPIRYRCFQRIASTSVVAATVATASARSKRRNSTWIKDNLIE